MRLKYYLRGIGIGVIVTTLVLMIALTFHKAELLSDAEICDRAAELGMIMPEEAVNTVRDTIGSQEKASASENQNTVNEQPAETVSDSKPKNDNPKTDEQKSEDSKAKSQKESKKNADSNADKKQNETTAGSETTELIEISIVGGEYSDIVSEKLRKAGLIDNPEDFNKFLARGNYDNLIQPGTYLIPVGADYKTIVKIITEKN